MALPMHPGYPLASTRSLTRTAGDCRLDSQHDCKSYFVLPLEDVLDVSVEALGPEMFVLDGVDQLSRDPHPVTNPSDTALDHIAYTGLPASYED